MGRSFSRRTLNRRLTKEASKKYGQFKTQVLSNLPTSAEVQPVAPNQSPPSYLNVTVPSSSVVDAKQTPLNNNLVTLSEGDNSSDASDGELYDWVQSPSDSLNSDSEPQCSNALSETVYEQDHYDPMINVKVPTDPEINVEALKEDWTSKLRTWAINNNVTLTALGSLLTELRPLITSLPKDPRTLMNIESCVIEKMGAGEYCNIGLASVICKRLECCDIGGNEVLLNFNVDGLPLFKSSGVGFWPILGLIVGSGQSPFVCSVYCGVGKPPIKEFLKDFTTDLGKLLSEGLVVKEKFYRFKVNCILCDAPAKSYIKCTVAFNAYHGCDNCYQKGTWFNGRMTFPELNFVLRTDQSFVAQSDPLHHTGVSPLLALGIGMISNFPLDYMHLVCLGVMKKLLNLWTSGPLKNRMSASEISRVNKLLAKCTEMWPSDFSRKPRSLSELSRWKAIEFRQFLLYVCVVLKSIFPKRTYEHFLLLHAAITIYVRKELHTEALMSKAEEMLKSFVRKSKNIYGQEFLVHNVHNLLHLGGDVRQFGALDEFSCFTFENELYQIKRMIRGKTKPLQQFVNRMKERDSLHATCKFKIRPKSHERKGWSGPMAGLSGDHFHTFVVNEKILTPKMGDNAAMLDDSSVILCANFVKNSDGEWAVGKRFRKVSDLYAKPMLSSLLGIFIGEDISELTRKWPVSRIRRKCVVVPLKGEKSYAIYPLN